MSDVCFYSNPSSRVLDAKSFPYFEHYNNSSVLMPENKDQSIEFVKQFILSEYLSPQEISRGLF